jgi:uncharacterized protein (DUF362 family)
MDILDVIKPPINILDGIYSLDQSGPTSGRIRRTDFLMASRDVVALDMAACEVGCVDLERVSHIHQASEIYGTKPDFSSDFRIDCEVPTVSRMSKVGAHLQHNSITKKLLKNPEIYSFAKKVKDTIEGSKDKEK